MHLARFFRKLPAHIVGIFHKVLAHFLELLAQLPFLRRHHRDWCSRRLRWQISVYLIMPSLLLDAYGTAASADQSVRICAHAPGREFWFSPRLPRSDLWSPG